MQGGDPSLPLPTSLEGYLNMANILLVDDQPYMGEFLAEELSDMGHSLKWLGSGDSLVLEIEETRPDLVLLDLFIDGFEGWTLLEQIKRHDPRIPVIVLTAYDSYSKDSKLCRAQGYVIKDFKTGELRNKITEVLASSKAEISNEADGHLTPPPPPSGGQ